MPKAGPQAIDLSSPEKCFETFVNVLQNESIESLEHVVTPTGMSSLVSISGNESYQQGMADLGRELASCQLEWAEITQDIYFLLASANGKLHKLEFTLEEPGWMLYHWQIGGGVDQDSPH